VADEPLLPVGKPELQPERRIGHRPVVRLPEGAHQQPDPALEQAVALQRHEARPEHRRQRPIAEHQPAAPELVRQHRLRRLRQLVGQQLVILGDGILHGAALSARR
jgi:hypothetical protein